MFNDTHAIMLLFCLIIYWILSTRDDEFVFIKAIILKFRIICNALIFMILSKDTKGIGPKYNPDPEKIIGKETDKKTIIFIRHGESDWNDIFNKGINVRLVFRFLLGVINEFKVFPQMNSTFIDSPLNNDGIEQAYELRNFINKLEMHDESSDRGKDYLDILRNNLGTSVVVTSSLRRAIATTTVALWSRIKKTNEKIVVLSSLQEISRNIDTQALSQPHSLADLPFARLEKYCPCISSDRSNIYELSENHGNKTRAFYGIKRLRAFSEWAFQRKEAAIIVGGHSLWFRSFFQTFLPFNCDHDAKKKKITNSGAVAFTFYRSEDESGTPQYRIDPVSIETIYGGYTSK